MSTGQNPPLATVETLIIAFPTLSETLNFDALFVPPIDTFPVAVIEVHPIVVEVMPATVILALASR